MVTAGGAELRLLMVAAVGARHASVQTPAYSATSVRAATSATAGAALDCCVSSFSRKTSVRAALDCREHFNNCKA